MLIGERQLGVPLMAGQAPVIERLKTQRKEHEQKVFDLTEAIKKLEEHPEMLSLLESLNKLGPY